MAVRLANEKIEKDNCVALGFGREETIKEKKPKKQETEDRETPSVVMLLLIQVSDYLSCLSVILHVLMLFPKLA